MHVKIQNNLIEKFPYDLPTWRKENPTVSFPKDVPADLLNSYGVYSVSYAEEPKIDDRTQKTELKALPELVEGVWVLQYDVIEKTAQEIADYDALTVSIVRNNRNAKLSASDWVVIKSLELDEPIPQEWLDYRQALRDITLHNSFPNLHDSDWPTPP